ncbi:MAG TPA: nitrous oxide reductase accessory protein NosL [Chloroflexota bacterium]|nr:nitrous oxide reductase accessory protein NosL [Chloroflexota bacterium]
MKPIREGREGKARRVHFTAYCLLLTAYFFLALTACTGANLDAPPEIAYGRDVCVQCGMIISEPRFAASYTTKTGDVRLFESIEDMAMYHIEHQEDVHLFWVHDYETEEWVKGDEAVYVLSETIVTPMGAGVVAAANRAGADELVKEGGGTAVTLDQLLTLAKAGMLGGHDHSMSH